MPRPNPETATWPLQMNYRNGSFIGSTDPTSLNCYVYRRTWSGVNTPNFRSLKAKQLPINSHSSYIQRDAATSWTWTDIGPGWNDRYTSTACWGKGGQLSTSPHIVEARSVAAARLAKAVNGMKVNLAQAFAERKLTAELFITSVRRLTLAATSLRRGDLVGLYSSLGMASRVQNIPRREFRRVNREPADLRLANLWLEYKYGWLPVLSDVRGAAELLASSISGDIYHEAAEASAKVSSSAQYLNMSSGYPQSRDTAQRTTKSKYTIRYRLDNDARAVLAQTGITNPVLLAWELLPYSFVVDWFIPVGNYLESLDAYSGFVLVDGCWVDFTVGYHLREFSYFRSAYGGSQSGTCRRNVCRLDRGKLTTFPSQALPSFRNPLGNDILDRFTTASSLLRQAFRR